MKQIIRYRFLLVLLAFTGLLAGCGSSAKRMNKRITLWRNDKIPYGTWYAYEQLPNIFPKATVLINKRSPDRYKTFTIKQNKTDDNNAIYDDNKITNIIIANRVIPDESEVIAILGMVAKGQNVFISGLRIGETLLDSLRLKTALYTSIYNMSDSLTVSVKNPVTSDSLSFSYPGMALDNYFESLDSSITSILGKDKYGRANFVRFSYVGGGSLYIHLAPMAFTNFFLLHKNNKLYYDNVLSYLPPNTELVKWDDYFRYHESGNENGSSPNNGKSPFAALSWITSQPGLAAAFGLLLVLLLIIYLFESKRKQRIIPVIPPLKNASLDFVKTIGRLYFQRRDNKNLAQKMTVHFQDHVRSRYGIRNSFTDPEFEKRLAWKTGYDINAIKDLVYYMKMIQDGPTVSDEGLLELNRKLEHFYKYV